jgi:hypothetical protein
MNITRVDHAIVRWHIASEKHGSAFPICEHVIESEPTGTEQLANARLIAAAPLMYEALDKIAYIGEGTTPEEMREIARAAIAKAKQ